VAIVTTEGLGGPHFVHLGVGMVEKVLWGIL